MDDNLTEDQMLEVAASVVLGMVSRLVAEGVRPATALRYASTSLVEEVYGTKVLVKLGLPERTLRRWHVEIEESMPSGVTTPDELPADVASYASHRQYRRREDS